MESAIRTFLEKEYPMAFSQGSDIYSLKEKSNGKDISFLLKEMEQLEKEYAHGQLKMQHVESTEMLNQEKESDTYGLSETVNKKMLDVSRAVFGMPAKRREKNEDACYGGDICLQSTALTFEETDIKSEITVMLDSGANRSNKSVVTDLTPNPAVNKCELENPLPSLEICNLTHQSKTPLTGVLNSSATCIARRNLNNSISDLYEFPMIESDCQKSSAQSKLTKTESDVCPVERFRNFIRHRIQPKYQSKHIDLPPITKFRETFHCLSNIEIPAPLENFARNALQLYLGTSELLKLGVNTKNKCDKSNAASFKNVKIDDYETAQQNLLKCKFSCNVPTDLKYLLLEVAKNQASVNTVCKEIHDKDHNNYEQQINRFVQDASKTLISRNVAEPAVEDENIENTEADTYKFERNISRRNTSFPDQSLRTRAGHNLCSSSSYKVPSCNEFNKPHKEIIDVEEFAEFQCCNEFNICDQSKRETRITTTTSGVPKRCVKTSFAACNDEWNFIKTSDLASNYEVGKVKEHLSSAQYNHATHKARNTHVVGRDMFPLTQKSNKVCKQLKLTHPKTNVRRCYTKTYSANNGYSRNYCTSFDFLCTLEGGKSKNSKCTAQNSVSVYQATDFRDERAVTKTSTCHGNSYNIQTCTKSVIFNSSDKMVFNNSVSNNLEENSVKMVSNSDCVLHNVDIVGKCVSPDLGAVTFRFSPKVEIRRQLGYMDVLQVLSNNSKMGTNSKLKKKDVQHLENLNNHHVNDCEKGISQVMLGSDYALSRQQLQNSMILSSGSEADVESSNDTGPCSSKRRRINTLSFNKTWTKNKTLSRLKSNPADLYSLCIRDTCSEESLKRKVCYSIKRSENWKLNILSKEQLDEGHYSSFQGQEKTVEYLPSDRQGSRSRVVDESSQLAVDEKVSQVVDDSNDTIVQSSGSSYNSFSCLHQTANHKMIVSESSLDCSVNNCMTVSNQDPGNLSCFQKSLAVSSNENKTEREAHCSRLFSHETEEGNMIARSNDTSFPFGHGSFNQVETRTVGIMNNYFCKELSSENVYCKKACTESSPVLSNVINTLRVFYISHSASDEDNARTVGNESSILKEENVNSGEKSNMPQKIFSPKVTVVQGVSESCNSSVNNEMNDGGKNNSGNTSCEKEQSLFSKWFLPNSTRKRRISSSYKYCEDEVSQLPLMESISCAHEQLLSSKELSQRNTEHCGASTSHNCVDDERTRVLTRHEVPNVVKTCAQQHSSVFKESLSSTDKNWGVTDTSSILKTNDTPFVCNGLDCPCENDTLPSRNNRNRGLSGTNSFTENDRKNIFNSESNPCEQQFETHSFFELTQCNNNSGKLTYANIHDTENENGMLNNDSITCEQMTDINTTENEIECRVSFKKQEAGKETKPNKVLHPAACLVMTGNKLRENQSNLLDRKRRSETEGPDTCGKRNCIEKHSLNVSTPTCEPYENHLVSEVNMSNSISTQDLNQAFDNIMNSIVKSDTNKQGNHASILGQDDIADLTLRNSTVEMHVCKETEKISHSAKDNLKCPKGWEQRLDPKGKIFFVHVESGLTSYTVPNHLTAQSLYSMSERFAFLPKGMSPILKMGVTKSYKESEEKKLTPVSHQALCNVVTDSYSLMDELSSVKWKDVQEPKTTGKIFCV
jgi:hypothetical protein